MTCPHTDTPLLLIHALRLTAAEYRFDESLVQGSLELPQSNESLSSCHLTKHNFINSLQVKLDERTLLSEDALDALLPKISPMPMGSQRHGPQCPREASSQVPLLLVMFSESPL